MKSQVSMCHIGLLNVQKNNIQSQFISYSINIEDRVIYSYPPTVMCMLTTSGADVSNVLLRIC